MAALQPSVGGLPFNQRSFADVTKAPQQPNALLSGRALHEATPDCSKLGTHKGFPAIFIPETRWTALAQSFHWALVGKFSQGYNKKQPEQGRPSVEKLQLYFQSLDLKGEFTIGLLDNRHLLIQLTSEEDFLRLYSRMIWNIGQITMRIFKWLPDFHVDKESSLVPVWISLPRLPIHLFEKTTLFQISELIGLPLRLDAATTSLKRPSVARLQVELDLLRSRPQQIWIGYGEREGFWQKVEYENLPSYCTHCWHVGHEEQFCYIRHPELKLQSRGHSTKLQGTQPHAQSQKRVYIPKSSGEATQTESFSDALKESAPVEAAREFAHQATFQDQAIQDSGPALDEHIQVHVVGTEKVGPSSFPKLSAADEDPLLVASAAARKSAVHSAAPTSAPKTALAQLATDSPLRKMDLIAVTPYPRVLPGTAKQLDNTVKKIVPGQDISSHQTVEEQLSPTAVSLSLPSVTPRLQDNPSLDIIVVAEQSESQAQIINPPVASIHCATSATDTETWPSLAAQQETNAMTVLTTHGNMTATILHPNAESSEFPTLREVYSSQQKAKSILQPLDTHEKEYNNSDYDCDSFGSDNLDDAADSSYDITDGSEGTIRQKRRDQRRLKARVTTQAVSKEGFEEQSRSLGKKLKK